MITVQYDDLFFAFEFVSSAPPMENEAYISLDTGKIYWVSASNPIEEEEVPDDLETSDRYIAIPHKNDLDLGSDLALRFVAQALPDHYERAEDFFRHKGAYSRFKHLLESEGILEQWYKFEQDSVESALGAWCADNGIRIREKGDEPSA